MKRFLVVLLFLSCLIFFVPAKALAVTDFLIENFQSEIILNQDTSLTISEKIEVDFFQARHGIYRVIPVIYSVNGKTIKAKFEILSVTNGPGQPIQYQTSRLKQSVKIKIGDSDKTITGNQIYKINYKIDRVVFEYPDHDEIYWNVTGSEWNNEIQKSSAVVKSSFAKINRGDCFSGQTGTKEKFCTTEFSDHQAQFSATQPINYGQDLTIVVGLDKNNQLQFPGPIRKTTNLLLDNWGYFVALAPLLTIFFAWYRKGRDKKYLSDNIYFVPDDQRTKTVSIFVRRHLPQVYSPIDKITPSQVGTIIDEKVDIQDVIAEIIELARLGYLTIKKTEKKGLVRKKKEYLFAKKKKNTNQLKDYQQYLLDSLFDDRDEVKLSDLKNKFYKKLPGFKKLLYQNLVDEGIFAGNPEKIRAKWIGLALASQGLAFCASMVFVFLTANVGPILLLGLTVLPMILLAKSMPRRKAWGYSLYHQIEGLKWYVSKGRWREEIHEKHLFFEEILPLAICLGIVKKLTKDMKELGVAPPDYFSGVTIVNLGKSLSSFQSTAASTLVSTPTPSGRSSWSGGSGFSGGGSSGGGTGGGGGGGW